MLGGATYSPGNKPRNTERLRPISNAVDYDGVVGAAPVAALNGIGAIPRTESVSDHGTGPLSPRIHRTAVS